MYALTWSLVLFVLVLALCAGAGWTLGSAIVTRVLAGVTRAPRSKSE